MVNSIGNKYTKNQEELSKMAETKPGIYNFNFENRFRVTFLSDRADVRNLGGTCITLNLPSFIMGVTPQPTAIRVIHIPGDSLEFEEVNMQFLVQESLENWQAFADWIFRLRNPNEINLERDVIDIGIDILNAKFQTIMECTLIDAFPFTISDIPMNFQIDDIEPARMDVTFKVNNFTYQRVDN